MELVKTRYRFEFLSDKAQRDQLSKEFGNARHISGHYLDVAEELYRTGYGYDLGLINDLMTLHRQDPRYSWLKDSSSITQQQSTRNAGTAMTRFFKKESGYPKRKNKFSKQKYKLNIRRS